MGLIKGNTMSLEYGSYERTIQVSTSLRFL